MGGEKFKVPVMEGGGGTVESGAILSSRGGLCPNITIFSREAEVQNRRGIRSVQFEMGAL